jgi:hypothetical protein
MRDGASRSDVAGLELPLGGLERGLCRPFVVVVGKVGALVSIVGRPRFRLPNLNTAGIRYMEICEPDSVQIASLLPSRFLCDKQP